MTRNTPTFDQRIAEWLEDDPNRAPSQVAATVLAALPSIRQRRRGWLFAGGRTLTMPNTMRAVAAIAVVAIVGLAAVLLLRPPLGPGGPAVSPSPTPLPAETPAATQSVVQLGTITLTDDGCTWEGNPGSLAAAVEPVIGNVDFVNETDTFANFGTYRLTEGRTWEEAASWASDMNDEQHGGPVASAPAGDFAAAVGNVDAPQRGSYRGTLTLNAGVHGVLCSSNEPPPGLIFAIYLAGPLEVTVR
jgi:hypothetical protein